MLIFENYQASVRIGKEILPIVRDFSLEVHQGEILGILGESGSGKTMAFSSILGLVDDQVDLIQQGRAVFCGEDLLGAHPRQRQSLLGGKIAYIFQNALTSFDPFQRIGMQLNETLRANRAEKTEEEIREMLEWVGIDAPKAVLRLFPTQLSGGMAQRIYIAMMLLLEPELIIADEPTSSVDAVFKRRILQIFKDINARFGTTIVLITHDFDSAAYLCDRIGVMYGGLLMELATCGELKQASPHPYTHALYRCVESLETAQETLFSIRGIPISPRQYGEKDCPFAPRCPRADGKCAQERPVLRPWGDHLLRCHHPEGGERHE